MSERLEQLFANGIPVSKTTENTVQLPFNSAFHPINVRLEAHLILYTYSSVCHPLSLQY